MVEPLPHSTLLQLLADQAKDYAVILFDVDGCVAWCNPGAERIFGCRAEEVIGKSGARFFTPEDIARGIYHYEMTVGVRSGTAEDDRWQVRSDGSRFWASGVLVPLHDADGTLRGFGKILRDRTDLKEQFDTLRNRVETLSRIDRQKDLFLSTLSHELRNPLAPLANAVQLLRLASPDNSGMQYPIKLIERQVDFIRRLVDDLLDVTRIGAGKIELQLAIVSLRDVLEETVESVRPLINQKRLYFDLLLPLGGIELEADRARLHQVFVNLLTNAAKYTPEGGSVWIKGMIEDDEVVVRVVDSGIGIAREMLPRIFDLFTQVDTASSGGGLGIGLALVKDLVALHGGTVQVRSEGIGKGSEFIVRLPLVSRV